MVYGLGFRFSVPASSTRRRPVHLAMKGTSFPSISSPIPLRMRPPCDCLLADCLGTRQIRLCQIEAGAPDVPCGQSLEKALWPREMAKLQPRSDALRRPQHNPPAPTGSKGRDEKGSKGTVRLQATSSCADRERPSQVNKLTFRHH